MRVNKKITLLAVDPAKSKPTWCASFVDGTFKDFLRVDHKKILSGNQDVLPVQWGSQCWAVIESPYFNEGHSPKNQISFAIAVGEIGQFLRESLYKIEYVQSWGNKGWIQQFFGQGTSREKALALSMDIAKADGVQVNNSDQSMAFCLGKWWLWNNRGA